MADTLESIKILQLGKFYPIRGGVEKVMFDLLEGISEKEVHCDMLCASMEQYPAGTYILNDHAKLIVVPTRLKVSATMVSPEMINILRKIAPEYDIIHIHHPDPMAALALSLSGYRGKVVLHWHSDILKQKLLLKCYKPLQNWLIERADYIVGTTPVYVHESPFLKKVQHKVGYVPIGVEPIHIDSLKAQQLRRQYKDKHIIFSLGRLVEYKGYEYLIRSAQFLNDQYHILIGGKGPMMEELQALINRLGLQHRVTLLGFLTDDDIAAYYGIADTFCLSSIWKTEAFAIVQIEAMSCAVPVVSTEIPGSGVSWVNANGYSGLTVPVADERSLAMAFRRIREAPRFREQLVRGSRTRYEHHFTRDKMIHKCMKIYIKCLLGNK
ncbi:glycosyltransferase [Olivibacter sp. CPCC 100613]|uniref:glycosyltransferase n=1 Tax=Olivibacter sp. CPCC 100613 TaxID=3079931 RepID=UPI002FFAD183